MKNLVLIIVLAGVVHFTWGKVTEDKPDWFLKFVAGSSLFDSTVKVDLNADPRWSEEQLIQHFEHLYLVCTNEPSDLGDRVCWTLISEFNGLPAQDVAFFFKDDGYQFLRVNFDAARHEQLKAYLDNHHRYLGVNPGSTDKFGQALGVWKTSSGILASFTDKPLNADGTLLTWKRRVGS